MMKLDLKSNDKEYNLINISSNKDDVQFGLCGIDLKLKKPKILK